MKNNYLFLLAKQILKTVPEGLSKVKFAKILYFTHKDLVLKELIPLDKMEFIRMPLGPVPVGFKELINDEEISIIEIATNPLVYDKQLYKLMDGGPYFNEKEQAVIGDALGQLIKFTTSELVGIAHKEPSWLKHRNGEEYFLTPEDLNLPLPTHKANNLTPEIDIQRLQAKLMEGMLEEIVDESTSLEYPDTAK